MIDPLKISLAEEYAEKAVGMSPNNQLGYWALAKIKFSQGRKEEGVAFFRKAVELNPQLDRAHWYLAIAYRIDNQPEKALEEAEITKELTGENNPVFTSQIEQFIEELSK